MSKIDDQSTSLDLGIGQQAIAYLVAIAGTIVAAVVFGIDGQYTPLIGISPAFALLGIFYFSQRRKIKEKQ